MNLTFLCNFFKKKKKEELVNLSACKELRRRIWWKIYSLFESWVFLKSWELLFSFPPTRTRFKIPKKMSWKNFDLDFSQGAGSSCFGGVGVPALLQKVKAAGGRPAASLLGGLVPAVMLTPCCPLVAFVKLCNILKWLLKLRLLLILLFSNWYFSICGRTQLQSSYNLICLAYYVCSYTGYSRKFICLAFC